MRVTPEAGKRYVRRDLHLTGVLHPLPSDKTLGDCTLVDPHANVGYNSYGEAVYPPNDRYSADIVGPCYEDQKSDEIRQLLTEIRDILKGLTK